MVTLQNKLAKLAHPAAGLMQNIRLAENSIAGFSFANGWVMPPPGAVGSGRVELGWIPVSGLGVNRDAALERMMMEAIERNSSIYIGSEELAACENGYRCAASQSLLSGEIRLTPASDIYVGCGTADSNGCAAGVSREDATYRGLLEVIERDALMIWWFQCATRTALGYDDDPLLQRIKSAMEVEKRSLELIDITTDLEVPVVVALTADEQSGHIYLGCAADVCQRTAAQRACLEMLQFWFWGRVGADPDYRTDWLRNETIAAQGWLRPKEIVALAKGLRKPQEEISEELLEKVSRSGFDPLAVDLTREWFQIPVVKVIVPGLVGLRNPGGGKRMFDLPKKMGWRHNGASEQALFRYPCQV